MTKNKYVDFSKTGLPNEVVAKMIQDVAFANGIYWWDSRRSYKPNAKNIGLEPNNTLSSDWVNNGQGDAVPLSEFLAILVEQGSGPVKPTKTKNWLDDLVGKQVLVWNGGQVPGRRYGWIILDGDSFFQNANGTYTINGTPYGHVALLTGHEYRAFLPYNQWVDHREEV